MIRGSNIEIKKDIDLFGVNIDSDLSFEKHVSNICSKVNNQFQVLLRFRKLTSSEIKYRLYTAFIMPHFRYCSSIWHLANTKKREALNKRILRDISFIKLLCKSELK